MKKTGIFIVTILILIISVLSFIKINTNIYIGNYSHIECDVDIQLFLDEKEIVSDTSFQSSIFPIVLKKKLKYGLHDVRIVSNEAKIDQRNRVFLLPNQHINIEFLAADTFCLVNPIEFHDYLNLGLDSMPVIRKVSSFRIVSLFNPFYLE